MNTANTKDGVPNEFSKLVAERYSLFTKSEQRIADFIHENQDEAAFLSAREIALSLGLSEPTMTRFARRLGFENYPAMREMLQARFRDVVNHSALIRRRLDDLLAGGNIYERLVTSEINFLTESLQAIDPQAFDEAVELLRIHQRIFVFGLGPAVSLVDLLEIRLTRFARHVIPLRTYGRDLLDPLLLMNKNDLLIMTAFRSPNVFMRTTLERAEQMKTPVILVTDTLGDLLGKYATVVLSARRGPVSSFSSLTVPMTIINSLLLALSSVDQESIMKNLDQLDSMREEVRRMELHSTPSRKA